MLGPGRFFGNSTWKDRDMEMNLGFRGNSDYSYSIHEYTTVHVPNSSDLEMNLPYCKLRNLSTE